MQLLLSLLRVFCIIAFVLIITDGSGNVFSFKSGNDDNNGRNNPGGLSAPNKYLFLSMYDKSIAFSSLLQAVSAQQLNDTREEGEGEEQDNLREDCGQGEHLNSEVDSCIPDEEKEVCDDEKDNDNDSIADLEDSECLPNDNEQEQEQQRQQDNEGEQEDKEKIEREAAGEDEVEAYIYNKENNKNKEVREESPVPREQQLRQDNKVSSNNNTPPNSSNIEDNLQNTSQNLPDDGSSETTTTTTINGNIPTNELQQRANTTNAEDATLSLNCHPSEAEMVPGEEDSIICTVENKTPEPIELALECLGLHGTGIECYINREPLTARTLINEMSHTNFEILLVTRSSPPVPPGSYTFTISAEECVKSDQC